MTDHSIYGFVVRTSQALPGVPRVAAVGEPDITIELSGMGESSSMPETVDLPSSAPPFVRVHDASGNEYVRLTYEGAGHELIFLLSHNGRHAWARWNALVGIEDVSALLTGPVLVCLLRLQQFTCLHASVINVDGCAVALLGAKGAGKTSTAFALVQSGGTLLSDDVAILDVDVAGALTIRGGQSRLRLRPDPAAALGADFDALPSVWAQGSGRPDKRYFELPDSDEADKCVPLRALYVLGPRSTDASGRSSEAWLERLMSGAALPMLMANRHMADIVDRAGHARDFQRLARVATTLPISILHRREGAEFVHESAATIRRDLLQRTSDH
ncbi:MAG: hypothetical protein ACO1Q7_19895 [Gemmatimonas sp.]